MRVGLLVIVLFLVGCSAAKSAVNDAREAMVDATAAVAIGDVGTATAKCGESLNYLRDLRQNDPDAYETELVDDKPVGTHFRDLQKSMADSLQTYRDSLIEGVVEGDVNPTDLKGLWMNCTEGGAPPDYTEEIDSAIGNRDTWIAENYIGLKCKIKDGDPYICESLAEALSDRCPSSKFKSTDAVPVEFDEVVAVDGEVGNPAYLNNIWPGKLDLKLTFSSPVGAWSGEVETSAVGFPPSRVEQSEATEEFQDYVEAMAQKLAKNMPDC